MARDDLTRIPAIVVDALGGGNFSVKLEGGQLITAKISGRLRKFNIRVIAGDRVTVGLSPYDISRGLILERERLTPRFPRPNQR